jgi:hypothetical protein
MVAHVFGASTYGRFRSLIWHRTEASGARRHRTADSQRAVARERSLIATDPDRIPPLALPPLEQNALGGTATGDTLTAIARDGARTVPARENGGNHDIKDFTRGSRVFYPVHVPGALFSGGDLHFSQGDGEITFCGAIEMGGFIDFHIDLIKGGMETYGVTTNPILMPGNVDRTSARPFGSLRALLSDAAIAAIQEESEKADRSLLDSVRTRYSRRTPCPRPTGMTICSRNSSLAIPTTPNNLTAQPDSLP